MSLNGGHEFDPLRDSYSGNKPSDQYSCYAEMKKNVKDSAKN
jgi:hypothetical protein